MQEDGKLDRIIYKTILRRKEGINVTIKENLVFTHHDIAISFMELSSLNPTRQDYLDAVVNLIQTSLKIECVGIRILNHGKFPFEAWVGYSGEFWEVENFPLADEEICICMDVIKGEEKPYMNTALSPYGTFLCNDLKEFYNTLSLEDKDKFQWKCLQQGFSTLVVIPIKHRGKILGAIHMADRGKNKIAKQTMLLLEKISISISDSIERFRMEEQLAQNNELLSFTNMLLSFSLKKLHFSEQRYKEVKDDEKIRTQFFANISHEFKTPLTLIFNTIQILEKYSDNFQSTYSDRFLRHIRTLKRNCYRLLKLINNLIDITEIDAGSFETDFRNHDIVSIVNKITLAVEHYAQLKDVRLSFRTDVNHKIAYCDLRSIERIVLNLLSNCLKNTGPGGSILVSLRDKKIKF